MKEDMQAKSIFILSGLMLTHCVVDSDGMWRQGATLEPLHSIGQGYRATSCPSGSASIQGK